MSQLFDRKLIMDLLSLQRDRPPIPAYKVRYIAGRALDEIYYQRKAVRTATLALERERALRFRERPLPAYHYV